ncbi:hypothetical protein ACFOVU_05480 [Nocardiopsis sediminis]|uniref:Secreted protein n=1 Tax=Nocardiopsis sediminis TaxID=1778267 RepID=A0ABV8FK42_9ACTN
MRKHHRRWIALAGATTVSLAGFGALGVGFAEEQRPPADRPVAEQKASPTEIDGFEVGYLPSGLARYGVHATSKAGSDGERRSTLSWLRGREGVYGRVDIFRSDAISSLEDVRSRHFGHLNGQSLRKADTEGRAAYRSDATGTIFWLQEPGVAVAAHLAPDTWGAEELSKFAGGIRPEQPAEAAPEGPESVLGGQEEPGGGPAEESQFPPAVPGATAPNARPDLAPGVPAAEVQSCLIEQLESGGDDAVQEAEGAAEAPAGDSARAADSVEGAEADARLIRLLDRSDDSARSAAVTACGDRFGLTDGEVNELIADIGNDVRAASADERGGAPTTPLAASASPDPDQPGAASPAPTAPAGGAQPAEGSGETTEAPAADAPEEAEDSNPDLLDFLGLGKGPLTLTLGR